MIALQNTDLITGAVVSALLASALFASPLFRNVALALAAAAVLYIYNQDGVSGLVALSRSFRVEIITRPDFARGLLFGLAFAVAACLGPRLGRP
jgi:hypothetical protein